MPSTPSTFTAEQIVKQILHRCPLPLGGRSLGKGASSFTFCTPSARAFVKPKHSINLPSSMGKLAVGALPMHELPICKDTLCNQRSPGLNLGDGGHKFQSLSV